MSDLVTRIKRILAEQEQERRPGRRRRARHRGPRVRVTVGAPSSDLAEPPATR